MKIPEKPNRVKDRVCIRGFRNEYNELIPKGAKIEVVTYGPYDWDFKARLKNKEAACGQVICNKEMIYITHKKHFKTI